VLARLEQYDAHSVSNEHSVNDGANLAKPCVPKRFGGGVKRFVFLFASR